MKNAGRPVLLVSHARTLRGLLSKGVVDPEHNGGGFKEALFLDNAEVVECCLTDRIEVVRRNQPQLI